jgi:hypothetical protein
VVLYRTILILLLRERPFVQGVYIGYHCYFIYNNDDYEIFLIDVCDISQTLKTWGDTELYPIVDIFYLNFIKTLCKPWVARNYTKKPDVFICNTDDYENFLLEFNKKNG